MPIAVSIDNMAASVKRELGYREGVYPRWVRQGKMQPEKAATEIERMKAVLEALEELRLARDFIHQLQRADLTWLPSAPFSLVAVPVTDAAGASLRGAYEALLAHRGPLTMGEHASAP